MAHKTFPMWFPVCPGYWEIKGQTDLNLKLCSLPHQNCRCKVNSSYWEGSWESTFVFLVFCSDWETKEKLPFAQNWELLKFLLSKVKYQCVSCPITAASSTEGQFPPLLQLLWKRLLGQSSSWPHRALVRSSWWENIWVTQGKFVLSFQARHTCTTPRSVKLLKSHCPSFSLQALALSHESSCTLHPNFPNCFLSIPCESRPQLKKMHISRTAFTFLFLR